MNDSPHAVAAPQRIDKWLWFARCARTRSLSQKLVESGAVRINGQRTRDKSATVRPGDVLTIAQAGRVRILKIRAPGLRRGNAEAAAELFEDLSPDWPRTGPALSPLEQAIRQAGAGRPTKRERRQIGRLTGQIV